MQTFRGGLRLILGDMMLKRFSALLAVAVLLVACSSAPPITSNRPEPAAYPTYSELGARKVSEQGREVALFALSLMDTNYRFGGKNPEAGLDCSGMVSYVFTNAVGLNVSGSAAMIARQGRQIDRRQLQPGDLVFFNTMNRPASHVGIYIGDNRFIHAPSAASGRVRIDSLGNSYFAPRFESARSYFD